MDAKLFESDDTADPQKVHDRAVELVQNALLGNARVVILSVQDAEMIVLPVNTPSLEHLEVMSAVFHNIVKEAIDAQQVPMEVRH